MSKILNSISTLLAQARDAGASAEQVRNLRQGFKLQFDWNPTKKRVSPEKRKRLRKIQKESRRINRGTGKGQPNRKGHR